MFNDQKTIEQVLAKAVNIFSVEGDERVMLVYKDNRLYHNTPGGSLVFKPIADVESIIYIVELNAWQVTWIV